MIWRYIKILVAALVMLHFMGITQLTSAFLKDKAQFASMLNMTEEESKKEKDSKEDDALKDIHYTCQAVIASVLHTEIIFSCSLTAEEVIPQHSTDQLTPPPDLG